MDARDALNAMAVTYFALIEDFVELSCHTLNDVVSLLL